MKSHRKKRDPSKPKKKMTAYNYFFKEVRPKILENVPSLGCSFASDDTLTDVSHVPSTTEGEKNLIPKKRNPVIVAGKISFDNLAKEIGKRWNKLPAQDREIYNRMAANDSVRYEKELEVYNKTRKTQVGCDEQENNSIKFPCRARKVADDHNNGINAFLSPIEGKLLHGIPMVCSHIKCRMEGVKFLYCSYCRKCSAKHHFRFNHAHKGIMAKEMNSSETSKETASLPSNSNIFLDDLEDLKTSGSSIYASPDEIEILESCSPEQLPNDFEKDKSRYIFL